MERKFGNLIWILVALVSVIAAIAIIVSILYGGGYYGGTYGPYNMMGGFYGMGIIMPVIAVISVVFVLVFIYFIFESMGGNGRDSSASSKGRAEEIARERFARGDITEQEFNTLIENLRR